MALNSNRGDGHERQIGYAIGKLRKNMGFITQEDIKILEWMGNKGDYPEEEVKLVNKEQRVFNINTGDVPLGKEAEYMQSISTQFKRMKNIPFVDEVEEFNKTFGKPNNYEPTVPEDFDWKFVYEFILEELEEYREACEKGDIVEVLDALCDITYVSLGNGVMLHGLKGKIWPAYQEVQASNMSKSCKDEEEAKESVLVRAAQQGEACHYEKVGERWVVYRSRDKKVMKSINYFRPDLTQFFTTEELQKCHQPTSFI